MEHKFLLLVILLFVIFKIPDLDLPYYWDEAWSYMPAIWEMENQGPSLLPNAIDPDLYRGHPLFFYFLSSSWLSIFGDDIWITRLLPLLISIILLVSIHRFIQRAFDLQIANLTIVFFSIQSVFIAQSTYLLPEVLLALLTVLSIEAFFNGKKMMTAFWLLLALFTKETAVVLWGTIFSFQVYELVKNGDEKSFLSKLKSMFYLLFPLVLFIGFFLLQKLWVGWFFYPDHLSYVKFSEFFEKLEMVSATTFIYGGRNVMSLLGIVALIYLVWGKMEVLKAKQRVLLLILIFTIAYLCFSALNFFTQRYLLSILPFTIAGLMYIFRETFKANSWLLYVVLLIIFSNNFYFTLQKKKGYDHDLGGREVIQLHSEMANFCEDLSLQNKSFATNFLMRISLTENRYGYLNEGIEFTNIDKPITDKTQFVILSSIEIDPSYHKGIEQFSGKLLRRIERGEHWVELYGFKKLN